MNREKSCILPVVLMIFALLMVAFAAFSKAYGFEIPSMSRIGITLADESKLSSGWPSSDYDYQYLKVFAVFEEEITKNLYLDVEPGIGLHHAWGSGEDKNGVSLGIEGWFCYNLLNFSKNNRLYLGVGVGVLTMIPSGSQPEISNSGVLGMFGGRLGYRYKKIDLSLGLEHFSDALHNDDTGRNFGTIKLSYGF